MENLPSIDFNFFDTIKCFSIASIEFKALVWFFSNFNLKKIYCYVLKKTHQLLNFIENLLLSMKIV
jgi:hypothetical protein